MYNYLMAKYPIFLELGNRRVVVIGAGNVALQKIKLLRDVGARIVVIADKINDMMAAYCKDTDVELIKSRYSKSYLPGVVLVIAATSDQQTNALIYKDCRQLEILCNVVDDPRHCDFFVPAVVNCGDLQIAIGTNGKCPAYAGYLRKKLEQTFTEKHGQFLVELENTRKQIIESVTDPADRKAVLEKLVDDCSFEHFVQNGVDSWQSYAKQLIEECQNKT